MDTPKKPKFFVVKRSGDRTGVRFDAITDRNESLCSAAYGHELRNIDAPMITQEVIRRFKSGMSTHELDLLTVKVCSELSIDHQDYADLAARILVSDLQKSLPASLKAAVERLEAARSEKLGRKTSRLSAEYVGIVRRAAASIDRRLVHSRDFAFRYFGIVTMLRSYLLREADEKSPLAERPQHAYMRVALALHCATPWHNGHEAPEAVFAERLELAFRTYDLLSTHKITVPSPVLFNAGTLHFQGASCFLHTVDDDLDTLLRVDFEIGQCAKRSGASGVCLTPMRAEGALVRTTGGESSGVSKYCSAKLQGTRSYVNQGGRRPGVVAPYLAVWHDDIFTFVRLGRHHGVTDNAPYLQYGLWIPDPFMEAVVAELEARKANGGELPEGSPAGDWWLFSPNDVPGLYLKFGEEFRRDYAAAVEAGLFRRKVKASEIVREWFETVAQRGNPYVLFSDHINRKSNLSHYRTITTSNVCVPAETLVLTDSGHLPIGGLVDQAVRVWNGEAWSNVTVRRTGADQSLVRVALDNGAVLDCTPAHKFYDKAGVEVRAGDLRPGVALEKVPAWPIIRDGEAFPHAYTHGLFTADGHHIGTAQHPSIHLYGEKLSIMDDPRFEIHPTAPWISASDDLERMTMRLPPGLRPKYEVPIAAPADDKLRWFEGYCDGDGCVVHKDTSFGLQACSIDLEFLRRVRLMLLTLGCDPKITEARPARTTTIKGVEYQCRPTWRLLVNTVDLWSLIDQGFKPHRLKFDGAERPNRDARRFVRVASVEALAERKDTFCFTEPLRGRGVFNGILTGQCAEVLLPTVHDEGEPENAESGVCFLGAVPFASHVVPDARAANPGHVRIDWEGVRVAAGTLAVNIDKTIDLNAHPTAACARGSSTHRAIGIGSMGLADVLAMHRYAYDSDEALELDEALHAMNYYAAMEASSRRAEEISTEAQAAYDKHEFLHPPGNYRSHPGSPASQGLLQPDLWERAGHLEPGWEERVAQTTGGALTPKMWAKLRERVKTYLRNGYVTACMPTATSSNAIGQNECFEPFTSNLYTRKTLAGEFLMVNRYLVADLESAGVWDEAMGQALVAREGSVQPLGPEEAAASPGVAAAIARVPAETRRLFRTAREIDQRWLTLHAAARGPFVSQSQSLNYYFGPPRLPEILSVIVLGWQKGLTTGSYYIHTKAATGGIKTDIRPPRFEPANGGTPSRPAGGDDPSPAAGEKKVVCTDDVCTSCGV